jgi:hypothetical protein
MRFELQLELNRFERKHEHGGGDAEHLGDVVHQ